MKRKLNTLELRRLKENGGSQNNEQDDEKQGSPQKKRSALRGHPSGRSWTRREDPREHQDLGRDEIALMFMEVSEKIDRCFDFDLQKWLNRYETLTRNSTNFPEAAMLIMSAAQIYGRKVDYLEDIILHMDQDQKGREESNGEGGKDKQEKAASGRKRTTRFQPQSLSDCFSDLEFTFVDSKQTPLESLVSTVQKIDVDKRNKFQQMQDLCNELRTMPAKQRRQEILNRLRDEANIPLIMSSHTAASKHQILDLESGETIGTRYDYQIYLNFIDVKTGSLTPEHNLKKFFQRCDVIDYLYEQQECERERCERNGMPAPEMVFPLKPREFKMYIPPDYLRNKYRIEINDTSDFDNELHQAKSSNYRTDPILNLMKTKFATRASISKEKSPPNTDEPSFCNVLSSSAIEAEKNTSGNMVNSHEYEQSNNTEERIDTHEASLETSLNSSFDIDSKSQVEESEQSEQPNNTTERIDAHDTSLETSPNSSFDVNSTSQVEEPDESLKSASDSGNETSQNQDSESSIEEASLCQPSETIPSDDRSVLLSKESSPEPELMALEGQSATADQIATDKATSSTECPSRLSYEDEGIGADRETPPDQCSIGFSRTPSLDVLSDCIAVSQKTPEPTSEPFFSSGIVIPTGGGGGGGSMRTIVQKPALVELNVLKIPECHLRKHLLFVLPPEYRQMKLKLVRKKGNPKKDIFTLEVYSLNPRVFTSSGWEERPETPEPEDFYGFDDSSYVPDDDSFDYELQSSPSRASTPESDFYGFDDCDLEEQANEPRNVQSKPSLEQTKAKPQKPAETAPIVETQAEKVSAPSEQSNSTQAQNSDKTTSQPTTPSRTLSRDSGISDDQNDRRESRSKEATPEPCEPSQKESNSIDVDTSTEPSSATAAEPQSALTSEKYIQSVTEAKELIEKVNNWHRKLKPILIQSEQRNHFDIHAYGTEIIDSFVSPGANDSVSNISFAQIMNDKQQDYTARYFLSMLMLANTNNVQIITRNQDPNRLTGKEDIELRLISRKRHHHEMESMGERIPCENKNKLSGKIAKKGQISRGNKRKLSHEIKTGDNGNEVSGAGRLRDDDELEHDFLDKIQRLYPDINGEETMRKRMAFQRGMRRCTYGMAVDVEEVENPPQVTSKEASPQQMSQEENEQDEVLSVDLLTNEAVMVPIVRDQDPCCSKSIFSMSESGYGSMLGDGDQ